MFRRIQFRFAGLLIVTLAVALLGACASGPKVDTQVFETPEGVAVVQTVRMVATVQAIDARTRKLTLKPKRGDVVKITASDSVANFNQIQIGDELHIEVVEEFALTLVPGGAAQDAAAAKSIALAPLGSKPGVVTVTSVEVTATVIAIDAHDHTVTLELLDGSIRELQVSKSRDLSTIMLGDSVRAEVTEAIAIDVSTPTRK